MADAPPALQLLNQMFSGEQLTRYTTLDTYLKKGGSIFPLVERGVPGLVRDFEMSPADARQFLRRANSMATYVRRQFIEHTLTGSGNSAAAPLDGLLSMVLGPNYQGLFDTRFEELCPPDALESIDSPVAYLIELLRWIRDRIEPSSDDDGLLLHTRRTDLKLLSVDFNAVHKSVSSVDIITSVLERFITANNADLVLEDALIEARYPNGLPYYQHWVTLDAITRHHGLSVGNFAHMVDLNFPYFLQAEAWDADAGRALAHASRLGPYMREMLTEDPPEHEQRDAFYLQHFGAEGVTWQNLNQVPFFGERTKLDAPQIEALLSVRSFLPVRSANVTYTPTNPAGPESERSGSVYINAHTPPPILISDGPVFLNRLSADPRSAEGLDRYDRMNRKVRLDQWLGLPSDQVDALLAAAIRAEVQGGADESKWLITDNVVHALGLFQALRERYGCTAHDFAVFIDQLSIYGRGDSPSQFDQVFNHHGDYREPLKLDNGAFPVLPAQGSTDLTVNQLCSGLGIDPQTYYYLALAIDQAHDLKGTLKRSPAVISSFYRMVKLPRLLGITPVEGVLMLRLLGGESWLNGLAGVPRINTTLAAAPDVLNLIYAMHSCTGWCRDRDIPVLWMLQQVSAPQPLSAAAEREVQLFEQVRNLLSAARFTNAGLLMAGVPPLPAADWLDLLTGLVDADGLVLASFEAESDYLALARAYLEQAVKDGLGDIDATQRAAIVEKMLGVLLQAREAQVSVAKECLAVYTGVDAEQTIRVLSWANATVHLLLRLVLERTAQDPQKIVLGRRDEPDLLLALLADVRRRSAVVAKLDLSAALLQDYLDYGHKAWLHQDDKHAFSVRTLYYLSALTRAFEMSEQPAQKLLDYLRQVNALPSVAGDALKLAQQAASIKLAEFFDWSVQEVRECVSRIDPKVKVLKDLIQLDLLMRVRVLSTHTDMDALTIFLIGHLPEAIDKTAYADAAEHALLSLSESRNADIPLPSDLKQLVKMTCTVDNTEVVANKPEEKINFTVTLTDDAGAALSGVNVYWSATLGRIDTKPTSMDGTVNAEFIPGAVMGTDTPLFWLDLFEPEYAPTINVIADPKTLTFVRPLMSAVPSGPVAQGHEVELFATLIDAHKNLGKNQLVRWSSTPAEGEEGTSLVIRPAQGLTNQEGLTRVFVSSRTGGTFTVNVLSESSERSSNFDPITFVGDVKPA
ncbi:virulence plasmid 28 protein [Pseudomonas mandelii]|uniref:Tc toxin subunit A n=1 Tax=Pseudomonas mandelii TaxID=75612 RepID=UPI0012B31071|nr:Tc toxin subunit A [Pseudomonas mandelii]MSU93730.1 virulence plasmid 28 protein [Pseudomonas mandelii]